jgi:anti-anti-sigma factor
MRPAREGCELTFSVEQQAGQERRYCLVGELDLATASVLMDTFSPVAAEDGDLHLDLTDLTFIDSSGIRGLLLLAEAMGGRGRLILTGPTDSVRRTLTLVGIEQAENIEISKTG